MSFDVAADSYGRYIGRYFEPIAAAVVRLVDLRAHGVLDARPVV